jgi:tetratricopeptide (TPR) repeat protein
MIPPEDIAAFRLRVRKRHPKIRAFEEDDSEWHAEGMDAIETGRFGLAENKFQKLILSQPNHFDGYEGLARVYAKTGRLEEARMLMDYALELALHYVDEGTMDREPFEEMKAIRAGLS